MAKLNKVEKKALKNIEKEIGVQIPELEEVNVYNIGYKADNGTITSLSLSKPNLSSVPFELGLFENLIKTRAED